MCTCPSRFHCAIILFPIAFPFYQCLKNWAAIKYICLNNPALFRIPAQSALPYGDELLVPAPALGTSQWVLQCLTPLQRESWKSFPSEMAPALHWHRQRLFRYFPPVYIFPLFFHWYFSTVSIFLTLGSIIQLLNWRPTS